MEISSVQRIIMPRLFTDGWLQQKCDMHTVDIVCEVPLSLIEFCNDQNEKVLVTHTLTEGVYGSSIPLVIPREQWFPCIHDYIHGSIENNYGMVIYKIVYMIIYTVLLIIIIYIICIYMIIYTVLLWYGYI